MSWRDLLLTPAVMGLILGLSGGVLLGVRRFFDLGLGESLLLLGAVSALVTVVAIRGLVGMFDLKPGVYSYERHAATCWAWNLVGFLRITFLWFEFGAGLIPIPLRQVFYRLLGARIGPGIVPVSGRATDPWLVEIADGAIIGEGSLLVSHVLTPQANLVLGRISVGRGAVLGAHCVVMAGTTIGEGALVNAMSLLPMNTVVQDHEVWGGNPACKIGEVPGRNAR